MTTYSVGFIHYGSLDLTVGAVRQALAQSEPPASVVVVDNQVLESSELQRLLGLGVEVVSPGRNTGYAGGFNRCLDWFAEQASDVLWLLNSDVVLAPEAAATMLAAQREVAEWDVMGSIVTQDGRVWFGGGQYSSRTGRASHLRFGESVPPVPAVPEVRRVDWVNGCSIWINRHGAGAQRRADEHFFLYREELEWQVREPRLSVHVVEAPLVEHEAGAVTGGAGDGLGLTFMARNSWIMANRATGLDRAGSMLAWVVEFLVIPARHRQWSKIGTAVRGVRMRSLPGEDVVRSVRGARR